ncbi:MAG: TM0996/MTH895 family glutaredoxin-like protein [Desulfuromonadaceae bacterium]|nr:TM0996/MTH895 family glutaredoxin-like protein [Desulfuromonadaceae bacterium]
MKTIQILGTGCAKCEKLAANTQLAADQLGLEYTLEKVTEINRILAFGVMVTPALVVDGTVILTGRAPSVSELEKLLC